MKKFLLVVLICLSANTAFAQNVSGNANVNNHASTAYESYLTGLGRLSYANGYYIKNLGKLMKDYQEAIEHSIKNHALAVRTKNALKKEYYENLDKTTFLEKENKRLDMLVKINELKIRQEKLREAGILPKLNPSLKHENVTYKTYSEFKNSPHWDLMVTLKKTEQELDSLEQDIKLKNSIKFEATRRYQTTSRTKKLGIGYY